MLPGFYDDSEAPTSRIRTRQTVTPAFDNCTLLGVDEPKDRNKVFSNFNEYHLKLIDNEGKKQKLTLSYSNPLFPTMDDGAHPLPNMVNTSKVDLHELQPRKAYDAIGRASYAYNFRNLHPFKTPMKDMTKDVETVYFNDGLRRIDYVLAFEETERHPTIEERRRARRQAFEKNLKEEGLQIELEDKQYSQDGNTYFLKIHAPWKVLTRFAEIMNLKMPIKQLDDDEIRTSKKSCTNCQPQFFEYDKNLIPDEPEYFTCVFNRERESQFVIRDKETFFSSAQRSKIVWEILLRTKYDAVHVNKIGIVRLLNNGTYSAAFPLHEPHKISHETNIKELKEEILTNQGKYQKAAEEILERANIRTLLYLEWARPASWYKKQPLLLIRKYFGDKIGIYFAWLGFYTSMLIPAAFVGLICFLYGVATLPGSLPAAEICDDDGVGNLTICPLCDKSCPYKRLSESCDFSKVTYLFDNPATVFFSIFMSFWATMFLEFWKRYQARISWEWDLSHLEEEEEPPRPEFELSVQSHRINPVTKEPEPFLPGWKRSLRIIAASSLVLFMLAVVMGAVFGVIVYRIAVQTVLFSSGDPFIRENAKITVAVTSASINLIIILILDKIYQRIAVYLTNMERPRTQTDYENSFTFKMFLFQSINFYSSLIYIAFFKGSLIVGNPLHRRSIQAEQCDPSGCLFELCVQLAIIMVGKQMMNNIMEILYPKILNWWRARKSKSNTKQLYTRWEKDYDLEPLDTMTLFNEYLEMVIQYGFVTIFVASFPLAPLFALLNNIVEIRLDAYKFVTQVRRPMAARANDIGAWLPILKTISSAAVIVNAFVIGYTSGFVPRMVYLYQYSPTGNLTGYIENILSKFNTSDYRQGETGPDKENIGLDHDPGVCWYRDYRNPPNHEDKYERSLQYWHVFAARLAFVVIFEHLVFGLTGFMAYIIPDMPSDVKVNLRREKMLAKEALYAAELERLQDNKSTDQETPQSEQQQQVTSRLPEPTLNSPTPPSPIQGEHIKLFTSL